MAKSEVETLLYDFQLLTHMNIALYDGQFHCICNMTEYAPYCAELHRAKRCLERCVHSDRHAMEAAKRTQSPQIYTCPYGLWEALYPITDGGGAVGYLLVGAVLPEQRAKELHSLIQTALSEAPELSSDALFEGARSIMIRSKEELAAAERLLSMLAEYIAAHRLIFSERVTLGRLIGKYVQKNLSKKITLADLSHQFHCSTVTLTETFRREFGISIMQYVLEARMKLACRLLEEDARSVGEVAELCGFSDVEYFSRCFKKKLGVSPSKWRNVQKKE